MSFKLATAQAQGLPYECSAIQDSELYRNRSSKMVQFQNPQNITLAEAKKYMIQYFNAWNSGALVSLKAKLTQGQAKVGAQSELQESIKRTLSFYSDDLVVERINTSTILNAAPDFAAHVTLVGDDARNKFLVPFITRDGGSDHRMTYICLDKSQSLITAHVRYMVPKKTLGRGFSNLVNPPENEIAIDAYAVANYLIDRDGKIKGLAVAFDVAKFVMEMGNATSSLP